jgi:predicted DNA-binding transcriptional regulator AlpA
MKNIQFQATISLGEDATKSLVEILTYALTQTVAQSAGSLDEKREARLIASRKALFAGQQPRENLGLLIDSREAARLLKVSPRTLDNMRSTGRVPPPVKIGSAVRWSFEALKRWVDAGCPGPEQPEQ